MIKNKKYISILKSMISCVNNGDYYSVKELSNLELSKMQENQKREHKIISKIKGFKKFRNRNIKELQNTELLEIMQLYSKYILDKIEKSKDISQLQEEIISIDEFINEEWY